LKYIATHELAGVLQPITNDLSSSVFVPKRQIQKCLIILVFMFMFFMTASMTLCGHRTYIETSSTLSHMVTMSSAITRVTDWYESTMNIITKDLFLTPHRRYSNLHLHECTRDPYYASSSLSGNDLFRNISMSEALTDDVRDCVMHFDTNGRITGDQVNGEYTTDASGTLGITLNGVSITGSAFAFDFIVEKMQLVRNLSYNLFPASFFYTSGV
jgi:hypothetical protein